MIAGAKREVGIATKDLRYEVGRGEEKKGAAPYRLPRVVSKLALHFIEEEGAGLWRRSPRAEVGAGLRPRTGVGQLHSGRGLALRVLVRVQVRVQVRV